MGQEQTRARRRRSSPRNREETRPRPRLAGGVALLIAALVGVAGFSAASSLRIGSSTETGAGVQGPAEFLVHWQLEGSAPGTTPVPVPRAWSTNVAAPSRLGRVASAHLLNAGVAGHAAVVWNFNETAGIALSTELELYFALEYDVGTVAHSFTTTVYVETQARAPTVTLVFTEYWDSGGATPVVVLSAFEVSQVCPAIGACP